MTEEIRIDVLMPEATEEILRDLADKEWRRLRKEHNRSFMVHGPGHYWNSVKESEEYKAECEKIRLLREFLGLPVES